LNKDGPLDQRLTNSQQHDETNISRGRFLLCKVASAVNS